jgi:hypothetical protein
MKGPDEFGIYASPKTNVFSSFFGFVVCDIHTPEHLYNKFSEFPPIFRHEVIQEGQLGSYMQDVMNQTGKTLGKNRKLISSFWGKKIVLYSPLLRWYLSHGLIVTKVYSIIPATPNRPFESVGTWVSDQRRHGDTNPNYEIKAAMAKDTGNSSVVRPSRTKTARLRLPTSGTDTRPGRRWILGFSADLTRSNRRMGVLSTSSYLRNDL